MRNLLILSALVFAITMVSCNDDDMDDMHEHEEVDITFISPEEDETVSNVDSVHVRIEIKSEDEIHDVEIKLHPEDDANDLIIDHDHHSHESSYQYERYVDLSSYNSGTEFHLTVKAAKDHEGTEFETEDIHFKIP